MSQDAENWLKALAPYHGLPNSYQVRFTAECFFAKTVTKK
jgi:hypothetical protein